MIFVHAPRRRFVDAAPDEPFWQSLHRIADSLYLRLNGATLEALGAMRARLGRERQALTQALSAEGTTGFLSDPVLNRAVAAGQQIMREQVTPLLAEGMMRAGTAAEASTATALGVPRVAIAFNTAHPLVLDAIDTQAGALIRGVSDETLRAVRSTLRLGQQEGWGVTKIARELQGTIGLTERQAGAVQRLRAELEAQGRTAGAVQQQVERATRRALKDRATIVARTESIRAASAGQQQLWEQAERDGLWIADMRRHWLVTPDDRLCPQCASIPGMSEVGVGLHVPFTTPYGPIIFPPAHPQCRCSVIIQERT